MNTLAESHEVRVSMRESILGGIGSGSVGKGIGALAAIILTIIGLAGVLINYMAASATIVIGITFLMEGGLAGRFRAGEQTVETNGGTTAEFLGGLAGIVLGILAFFDTNTTALLAVAVLVFGAALLLGSMVNARVSYSTPNMPGALVIMGSSGRIFIGLAAIVLGILAVIGLTSATLILVGLLSLGAGILFGGSTTIETRA